MSLVKQHCGTGNIGNVNVATAARPPNARRALGGLLVHKQCWTLSWVGKLLVLFIVSASALAAFFNIYPALAITHRVDADVLVVEGWVHRYAVRSALAEFKAGAYERVYTTGGPVVGSGGYVNDFQTSASVGASRLKKAGLPAEVVQMVPSHVIGRDRTYSSAIALRDWFRDHDAKVRSFNIITEGAHARRTRLLFEKAFGSDVTIGVIAIPSPDFDAKRWWQYSEGVKDVIGEGISYLYAKFAFRPELAPESKNSRSPMAFGSAMRAQPLSRSTVEPQNRFIDCSNPLVRGSHATLLLSLAAT